MRTPPRTGRAPMVLALLIAVLAGASARASASTCPSSQIDLTGVSVISDRQTLDTTGANARGSYDLRTGRLISSVSFNEPGWASSSVATDDEYQIVGLPAGTPVDLQAEYAVSGSWNVYPGVPQGDFTCAASIATDSDSAGFAVPQGSCCHGTITQPLTLPLHLQAQEPFHLRLRLASQDYRGRVDLSAVLTFAGLPAGAGVVSCQGYSAGVTAARGPTWGRLKSVYR